MKNVDRKYLHKTYENFNLKHLCGMLFVIPEDTLVINGPNDSYNYILEKGDTYCLNSGDYCKGFKLKIQDNNLIFTCGFNRKIEVKY